MFLCSLVVAFRIVHVACVSRLVERCAQTPIMHDTPIGLLRLSVPKGHSSSPVLDICGLHLAVQMGGVGGGGGGKQAVQRCRTELC